MRRWTISLVVTAIVAATLATDATSHRMHPRKADSLVERERQLERALAHYTGAWRSWLRTEERARASARYLRMPQLWRRGYVRCAAVETMASRRACAHATLMVDARRRLQRTRFLLYVERSPRLDWRHASLLVQRVYPGTFGWLMSCSDAEGGHGPWKRFGGSPYYPGYEHTDAVGGWLQFRPSTFRGAWRRGYEDARRRGLPVPEMHWLAAWQTPIAQAVAGGYLRYTGQDDSHWSASWGNGC